MADAALLFALCSLFFFYADVGAIPSDRVVTKNLEINKIDVVETPFNRIITKNLMLSNGLDFGNWGPIEYCVDGSYARDIEAMFKDYTMLETDETALNALKLYCSEPDGHHTGYITSTIGKEGEWKGMRTCPTGLMTGMRAQVLKYQGTIFDDVAVQNVEMQCNYGESSVFALDEEANYKPGDWGVWASCDEGSAICGLEIRYESPNIILDTAAVCDISMFCCAIEQDTTVAPTTVPTEAPTTVPTEAPTTVPTEAPTTVPTEAPTQFAPDVVL